MEGLAGLAQGFAQGIQPLPESLSRGYDLAERRSARQEDTALRRESLDAETAYRNRSLDIEKEKIDTDNKLKTAQSKSIELDNILKDRTLPENERIVKAQAILAQTNADLGVETKEYTVDQARAAAKKLWADIGSIEAQTGMEREKFDFMKDTKAKEFDIEEQKLKAATNQFQLTFDQNNKQFDQTRADRESERRAMLGLERAKLQQNKDQFLRQHAQVLGMDTVKVQEALTQLIDLRTKTHFQMGKTAREALRLAEKEASPISNSIKRMQAAYMDATDEIEKPGAMEKFQGMAARHAVATKLLGEYLIDKDPEKYTLALDIVNNIAGKKMTGGREGTKKESKIDPFNFGVKDETKTQDPEDKALQGLRDVPNMEYSDNETQQAVSDTHRIISKAYAASTDAKAKEALNSVVGLRSVNEVVEILEKKQRGHWAVGPNLQLVELPWSSELSQYAEINERGKELGITMRDVLDYSSGKTEFLDRYEALVSEGKIESGLDFSDKTNVVRVLLQASPYLKAKPKITGLFK